MPTGDGAKIVGERERLNPIVQSLRRGRRSGVHVKRSLKKYGDPPGLQDSAMQTVPREGGGALCGVGVASELRCHRGQSMLQKLPRPSNIACSSCVRQGLHVSHSCASHVIETASHSAAGFARVAVVNILWPTFRDSHKILCFSRQNTLASCGETRRIGGARKRPRERPLVYVDFAHVA